MVNHLVSRNVTVNGQRTSLRLEQASWDALDQICDCEHNNVHEICSMIESARDGSSRTSAVRAFIVTYFHLAALRGGRLKAGNTDKTLSVFMQGIS